MNRIRLDAGQWDSLDDFYDVLLPALGAPDWHGRNLNALADSLIGGDVNSVVPPFEVLIVNADRLVDPLRSQIGAFVDLVEQAREDEGIEIYAVAQPPL